MPPMPSSNQQSVIARIEELATTRGDHPALIGGDRTLTFAEMNRAANRLAHALRATPGSANGFVAIYLPRTVDRIVTALGILKAGLGYVPIDPRLHDQGKRDLVAHADALYILTDAAHRDGFGAERIAIDMAKIGQASADDNPGIYPAPDANAYLRYTSGSTGTPKGVLHNHRAAFGQSLAYAEATGLRVEDRLCCLSFFPHPIILGTLLTGGAFTVIDPTQDGLRAVVARLRRDRVSVLSSTPSALGPLSVALQAAAPLPDLRCIALSGEPVSAEAVNTARRCMVAGGTVINNYGTSEFTQVASHAVRQDVTPGASVPVGRSPTGVDVSVVDADGLPVPAGITGEIVVHAAFMCSGYWKSPDLTRAVFGTDAPDNASAPYRTGDVGRIDADGELHLIGRTDNQIKLRGFRITPEEIETALRMHAGVAAVAVRPISNTAGTMALVAYIVPAPGTTFDAPALRDYARTQLPPHMVPANFIALDALPKTTGGKLDRAALPQPVGL